MSGYSLEPLATGLILVGRDPSALPLAPGLVLVRRDPHTLARYCLWCLAIFSSLMHRVLYSLAEIRIPLPANRETRTPRVWLLLAVAYPLPFPISLVRLFCVSACSSLCEPSCYLQPLPAARRPGADAHTASAVAILLEPITNRCCCRYPPSALCDPPLTVPFFVLRAVWYLRLERRPFSPGTRINTLRNVR